MRAKYLLFLLILGALAGAHALSVSEVMILGDGTLVIKLDQNYAANATSCQVKDRIVIPKNHFSFNRYLSMALSAQAAGKPIHFQANTCIALWNTPSYAYTLDETSTGDYFEVSNN